MKKSFCAVVALAAMACSIAASAAPAKVDPVAEGFPSWEGVTERNYIHGRVLTPSDLRHRVVVVVALKDDANLSKNIFALSGLVAGLDGMPAGHVAQWDTMEAMPRKCVLVISISDASKTVLENIKGALKGPKDMKEDDAKKLRAWHEGLAPAFYRDLALAGAEPTAEFPYVYVLDGKTADPVYKGVYKAADTKKIRDVISKAKRDLPPWKELTGVEEVQFFKDVEKKIIAQKPLKPCIAALKASIADKNSEKAREAQIMYDALNQFCSDLKLRITLEFKASPARAFADAQRLFKYFPNEKKSIANVDAMLKANKSAITLGKIYEKYLEWSQPDFMFKNTSDAKKAVQLVNTWKKPLEKMSQDASNPVLQGEASLILSQVEMLGDILMSKVPQK